MGGCGGLLVGVDGWVWRVCWWVLMGECGGLLVGVDGWRWRVAGGC